MSEQQVFTEIPLDELLGQAAQMKAQGWRFVQCHATRGAEVELPASQPATPVQQDAMVEPEQLASDVPAAETSAPADSAEAATPAKTPDGPAAPTMVPTFELTYSFSDDAARALAHFRVVITQGQSIPSVSTLFPAAFMFENEMHDLFGIDVEGISIDFKGGFYHLHYPAPMAQASEKPARKTAPKKPAAEGDAPEKPAGPAASDAN